MQANIPLAAVTIIRDAGYSGVLHVETLLT